MRCVTGRRWLAIIGGGCRGDPDALAQDTTALGTPADSGRDKPVPYECTPSASAPGCRGDRNPTHSRDRHALDPAPDAQSQLPLWSRARSLPARSRRLRRGRGDRNNLHDGTWSGRPDVVRGEGRARVRLCVRCRRRRDDWHAFADAVDAHGAPASRTRRNLCCGDPLFPTARRRAHGCPAHLCPRNALARGRGRYPEQDRGPASALPGRPIRRSFRNRVQHDARPVGVGRGCREPPLRRRDLDGRLRRHPANDRTRFPDDVRGRDVAVDRPQRGRRRIRASAQRVFLFGRGRPAIRQSDPDPRGMAVLELRGSDHGSRCRKRRNRSRGSRGRGRFWARTTKVGGRAAANPQPFTRDTTCSLS